MTESPKNIAIIFAVIFLAGGMVIFLDQVFKYGVLFSPDQFFHHEVFFVMLPIIGFTILIVVYALTRKKKAR